MEVYEEVYNTRLCWKCVVRKVNKSFFHTFWTQVQLILLRYIHFSNRRRKKKLIPGREKALTLQNQFEF